MNNGSDSEEESLVYVEFDENINIGKYRSIHTLGVDSLNPIIQMDDTFFVGKFETPVGTYMFFEEDKNPQSKDVLFDKIPSKPVRYMYKTQKVLKMEHAYVTPKGDRVQDINTEQQIPKDEFEAVSFSSIQEGIACFKDCLHQNKEPEVSHELEKSSELLDIDIDSLGGDTAENFRNRKGYFSINVQAACKYNLKFQDIVARWPGSSHDSLIFANSAIKYKFDNGFYGNGIILGDSGYFLNHYLLTPLNEPHTPAERLYNESQIRTRNAIERCFGVWKRRFPVVSIGMRCKLPLIQDTIVATAVLHNLAIDRNEEEPPIDPEVQVNPEPTFEETPATLYNEADRETTRQSLLAYFEGLL